MSMNSPKRTVREALRRIEKAGRMAIVQTTVVISVLPGRAVASDNFLPANPHGCVG
jgi:hypothetical protein